MSLLHGLPSTSRVKLSVSQKETIFGPLVSVQGRRDCMGGNEKRAIRRPPFRIPEAGLIEVHAARLVRLRRRTRKKAWAATKKGRSEDRPLVFQ